MLDVEELLYLSTAASENNLKRAADKLGTSQPGVTRRLSSLQSKLNNNLYEENSKPLRFTDEGLFLKDRGERILELVRSLQAQIDSYNDPGAGLLSVGIAPFVFHGGLADMLRAYKIHNPDVRIQIRSVDNGEMETMLGTGLIDIAVTDLSRVRDCWKEIGCRCEDRWGLLSYSGHPAADKEFLTPEDISGLPLIFPSDTALDITLKNWAGMDLEDAGGYNSYKGLDSLLMTMMCGAGFPLVPMSCRAFLDMTRYSIIPLVPKIPVTPVMLINPGIMKSPTANEFIAFTQRQVR